MQCYKEGKYDGRYNGERLGFSARVDYYIERHELIVRQIDEYYKEKGEPEFTYKKTFNFFGGNEVHTLHNRGKEKVERNRIRNKLEVALTNSIKNLRKKKYINDLPVVDKPKDKYLPDEELWIGFQGWRWRGIWLTKEGIGIVESLIIK